MNQISGRYFKDLAEVLLSPELLLPEQLENFAYHVYRGGEKDGISGPNITILPPWKVGQELARTFGHYHISGEQERYKVLLGKALCLIQKIDSSDKVVDIKAIVASENSFIQVPSNYGHLIINVGTGLLVTADWEPVSSSHKYEKIKEKKGFAYHIIDSNGELTAVPNVLYGTLPPLEWEYLDSKD